MKLFTCTDHDGLWPVGVASVVVAESEEFARRLLLVELERGGLKGKDFSLQEVGLAQPRAIILNNGDY